MKHLIIKICISFCLSFIIVPGRSGAQINSVQVQVIPKPAIDTVVYNDSTGIVTVISSGAPANSLYSVVYLEPNTISVPPPNTTGIFNLAGAIKAVFQITYNGCQSLEDTVTFGGRPLPLRLLEFTARLFEKNKGRLEWRVIESQSGIRYEVEQSFDGSNFTLLATVLSRGQVNEEKRYEAIDDALSPGMNYYRIKEIDAAGKSSYNEIRSIVYRPDALEQAILYPNPTRSGSLISTSSPHKTA